MTPFLRAGLIAGSFAALSFGAVTAQAQTTVAQWTFETSAPATSGPFAAEVGTGQASGFHAGAATVYSSPAGNGSARSFSSNTWAVGDYYQFAVSTLGLPNISVSWDQTGSNTGPRDFALSYSTNGTTFTNVGNYGLTAVAWSSATAAVGSSFSYAVAGASNAANVLFRLTDISAVSINGGTVAAGGTGRVDNFTVTSAVPEPGTWLMMLAGVGLMAARIGRRSRAN